MPEAAAPSRTLPCQFLFRNHNVGKSKSLSAIEAARRINPALKSTPLQDRVAPSTEGVFNTEFWSKLDLVVNALDNIKARLYTPTLTQTQTLAQPQP